MLSFVCLGTPCDQYCLVLSCLFICALFRISFPVSTRPEGLQKVKGRNGLFWRGRSIERAHKCTKVPSQNAVPKHFSAQRQANKAQTCGRLVLALCLQPRLSLCTQNLRFCRLQMQGHIFTKRVATQGVFHRKEKETSTRPRPKPLAKLHSCGFGWGSCNASKRLHRVCFVVEDLVHIEGGRPSCKCDVCLPSI